MDENDQEKTMFITSQGLYCYKVALWIEEHMSHLPKIGEPYVLSPDWKECGGIRIHG